MKHPGIDRALEQAAKRERERYDLTADEALQNYLHEHDKSGGVFT